MWPFPPSPEKKILHQQIKTSFLHVRQDTEKIFQYLLHLYQQNEQLQHHLRYFQQQLNQIPSSPLEIKKIIDSYYSYDHLHQKIEQLHHKLNLLSDLHDHHHSTLNQIHSQLQTLHQNHQQNLQLHQSHHQNFHQLHQKFSLLEKPKPSLKEKIVQRITRNTKNYLKHLILSTIERYHQISALQLKEMIVEEQGLCSKSSFYRLLAELEQQQKISFLQDGKQKLYFSKEKLTHR